MPRILKNIDLIALEKQRDVLYVTFHGEYDDIFKHKQDFNYEVCEQRNNLMEWLKQNQIHFEECFGLSSRSGFISFPYLGELYLDVPFDETDPQYQLLYEHLENTDGSMKIDGITWYCFPLENAIEIANRPEIDWDNF